MNFSIALKKTISIKVYFFVPTNIKNLFSNFLFYVLYMASFLRTQDLILLPINYFPFLKSYLFVSD